MQRLKKTQIDWNLAITGASAEYTILDLGEKAEDVRVELNDIEAQVGSGGASVGAAAGRLFFGKLFDGAKDIEIKYKNSSGLKTYGFSFDEEVVYRKDDANFITFNNLNGDLIELASGSYKVILRGNAVAKSSLLNAISIDQLAITTLEIDSSKLSGDISATWTDFSIPLLTDKATLYIREVGVHIDSSKFDSMPITITTFDGDLDMQAIFDGVDAKAALAFVSATTTIPASVGWSFPNSKTLAINGNYLFKNLSGTLDLGSLDTLSVGLSGNFAYKGINKDITLNNFVVNRSGVRGSISLNDKVNLFDNLDLTNLGVVFAGESTSGSAKLAYSNSSFLSTGAPLNLVLTADVNRSGISSFALDTTGSNLTSIDVANFATFNFTKVTASPSMDDFWVSLDGNVQPKHEVFKSNTGLEFKELKISDDGVSIASAGADVNITGASGSLGALSMNLTSLGIGFEDNLFYLSAGGNIDIQVAKAGASLKLYSNKKITINDIDIDIKQSGLEAKGSLKWYKNDGIYGDGFKATLGMTIAEVFTADGELRIGQKGDIFYWFAAASGGPANGIPFGSVTFYTVGGGIGYHMKYNTETEDFVPDARISSLMLTTTLGTTADTGFLWHGDLKVIAGFTESGGLDKVNFIGKSWILSAKSEKPAKRSIAVEIEYAKDTIHLTGDANVEYMKIKVVGKVDVMFSPEEKHIFVGTDAEYGYAFNITDQLGHVSVSFLGIDASGFFMVDTNAIAFGQGIHIDKHWSKDWWGPDPSLDLKLHAESKALIVYRPRFQMNLDVGVEVGLKACYGGCIDLGADVLLKLATPDPNYLYAKTRIYIFKTSIGFSGYIYKTGNPTLQAASEQVTPDVFNRVEPVTMDIGIMPQFQVISSFSTGQPIDIELTNVRLVNNDDASNVITLDSSSLTSDNKGAAYIPRDILSPSTSYTLSGSMTATYVANGETETKTEEFEKTYRTTSSDKIAFSDIVNSVSPQNNEQNIHEDKGVRVDYNREIMSRIGADSSYITDYKIQLFDSDENEIGGSFESLEGSFHSKFQPNKALRVYIYCVNEAGVVREAHIKDGQYLNPFNGFIVDRGDVTHHALNDGLQSAVSAVQGQATLESQQGLYSQDVSIAMEDIIAPSSEADEGTQTQGMRDALATPSVINPQIALPSYIRLEPINLKSPEALGELITVKRHQGKAYSYYRASKYKIKVFYHPQGKTPKLEYSSNFQVQFNNVPAESMRKVEDMHGNLEPTLTVSLDENRLGANGVYVQTGPTKERGSGSSFYNEVRTVSTDGLEAIGVYAGISTKVIGSWTIRRQNGTVDTVTQELEEGHYHYNNDEATFRLPGVLLEYSAQMQYISKVDKRVIATVEMELVTGDTFDAAQEAEDREEQQERLENASDEARDSAGLNGVRDLEGGAASGFSGRVGGKFGRTGGGLREDMDAYGDGLDLDMGGSGSDFETDVGFDVGGVGSIGDAVATPSVSGASGAARQGVAQTQGAGARIIIDTGY